MTEETKICEWCEQPFTRDGITPAKWGKRRACCVSHSGKLITRERMIREREMQALIVSGVDPAWAGVAFESYAFESDHRPVMRPETHVPYNSSATWAYGG